MAFERGPYIIPLLTPGNYILSVENNVSEPVFQPGIPVIAGQRQIVPLVLAAD